MRRLEALAIELAKLLALEVRREAARSGHALPPSYQETEDAYGRVLSASHTGLDSVGQRALATMRNGWRSKTPVLAALVSVGEALLVGRPPPEEAPDTPRDLDDAPGVA